MPRCRGRRPALAHIPTPPHAWEGRGGVGMWANAAAAFFQRGFEKGAQGWAWEGPAPSRRQGSVEPRSEGRPARRRRASRRARGAGPAQAAGGASEGHEDEAPGRWSPADSARLSAARSNRRLLLAGYNLGPLGQIGLPHR